MQVALECMYCGERWEQSFYNKAQVEAAQCRKCGDSSLKVKDAAKGKIDYYQGSPPFPEKEVDYGYDDYGSTD